MTKPKIGTDDAEEINRLAREKLRRFGTDAADAAATAGAPYCRDCAHVRAFRADMPGYARCAATVSLAGVKELCYAARNDDNPCGPSGKLFEPAAEVAQRAAANGGVVPDPVEG